MSMHRVMVVESQSELRSLMTSVLEPRCLVTPVGDAQAAERALRQNTFHAVIINMEIQSADPLALARQAAAHGCGTILIPDLPSQFNAAAQAGHLILGKPFRYHRLIELVDQACAQARPLATGQEKRAAAE
jgi:DNA-binding NtrC family response regulator